MPTTLPTDMESFRAALQAFESLAVWVVLAVSVGMAAMGVLLLLWGRVLHRAVLVVLAFPVGVVLGAMLADYLHVERWIGILVMTITTMLLAIVLARLIWAVFAGLCTGCLAAVLVGVLFLGSAVVTTQPVDPNTTFVTLAGSAYAVGGLAITHTFVAGAVAGLILGLFLPRATAVAVTSFLGANLLLSGIGLAISQVAPQAVAAIALHQGIVSGVFAVLFVLGLLYQSVKEVRAKRAAAGAAAEAAKKPAAEK